MARFSSLMIFVAIRVKGSWYLQGFDVVLAYPHSPIDEDIYVVPPESYPCSIATNVLRLHRAVYGTK